VVCSLRDARAVPLTVSVKTACEMSGLGTRKIWELLADGTLQSVHVGRRRLISYDSLRGLLQPTAIVRAPDTPEARP
jgi:excisionase family DNA binding protein